MSPPCAAPNFIPLTENNPRELPSWRTARPGSVGSTRGTNPFGAWELPAPSARLEYCKHEGNTAFGIAKYSDSHLSAPSGSLLLQCYFSPILSFADMNYFLLFEHNKNGLNKNNGARQWAIWAVLGPRRASNSTAQGRWWPQGLPRNDQFQQVL